MKKLLTKNLLLILLLFPVIGFGQAPEAFKYQAVIRDGGNLILTDQAVGMRLSIQQGSIGGTSVYTETFTSTSNGYGLVNLEIGTGISTDDFAMIDWANGPYFMETAVDLTGGTTYELMGTSQLMSVPYALYAKTSGNGEGPQGPAGNDGVDGAPGPQGLQGPAGENGINGTDGQDGAQGATGPAGADGNDGAQGPIGLTGPAGNDGTNGNDGAVGATGLQGPIGLTGPAGNDGTNGNDGAVGATGLQGPIGLTGPAGNDGQQGLQGPIGLTGPAGNDGTNGNDGAVGATGLQGPIGLTGPAGNDGTNGNDGAVGATGLQGPIGLTGPAGNDGTNGNDGAVGAEGPQGEVGPQGEQGIQGPTLHGRNDFSLESQFIVPDNVGTVYLTLEGSTGGNGGSISTISYNQLLGCDGGDALKAKLIMGVNYGDTINVEVSQNGMNGPVIDGGQSNMYLYTPPGGNGQELVLSINNEPLITIVGGEGGNGYYYTLNPGSTSNGPSSGGCLSYGNGSEGYIIYHEGYDEYPIMIVSSSVGSTQNKAIIKY